MANALRASTRDTAVIARSGGEEFTIADTSREGDPLPLARRICERIADLPVGVTTSVGSSSSPLHGVHGGQYQPLVGYLVSTADKAMYRAKRNGGDGFHYHNGAIDIFHSAHAATTPSRWRPTASWFAQPPGFLRTHFPS